MSYFQPICDTDVSFFFPVIWFLTISQKQPWYVSVSFSNFSSKTCCYSSRFFFSWLCLLLCLLFRQDDASSIFLQITRCIFLHVLLANDVCFFLAGFNHSVDYGSPSAAWADSESGFVDDDGLIFYYFYFDNGSDFYCNCTNIVLNKIWIGKLSVCLSITGFIDNHDGWVGRSLYCLAASVGAMQDLARLSRYPPSHNKVSPAAK